MQDRVTAKRIGRLAAGREAFAADALLAAMQYDAAFLGPEQFVNRHGVRQVGGATDARVVARVMAMTSAAEHMPLADVKNRLSEVVERLEREHGRVVITKHGRPAAVVLNIEDLEGLEETLSVLSAPKLMRRVRKSESDIEAGKVRELTKDEALALIKRAQ